jgi:hypothetical protein
MKTREKMYKRHPSTKLQMRTRVVERMLKRDINREIINREWGGDGMKLDEE